MTVKEQILGVLRTAEPDALTDSQLANITGRPKPSVRRARLELERDNKVYLWSAQPHMAWRPEMR